MAYLATEWLRENRDLHRAFLVIRRDAIDRLPHNHPFLLWKYERLSELYGEPDSWTYNGPVRISLYGGDSRLWLQERFGLWWRADDQHHTGLYFTADPRTGLTWDRDRIAAAGGRDGAYLVEMAKRCEGMNPLFRPHFRAVQGAAERMERAANRLQSLNTGR